MALPGASSVSTRGHEQLQESTQLTANIVVTSSPRKSSSVAAPASKAATMRCMMSKPCNRVPLRWCTGHLEAELPSASASTGSLVTEAASASASASAPSSRSRCAARCENRRIVSTAREKAALRVSRLNVSRNASSKAERSSDSSLSENIAAASPSAACTMIAKATSVVSSRASSRAAAAREPGLLSPAAVAAVFAASMSSRRRNACVSTSGKVSRMRLTVNAGLNNARRSGQRSAHVDRGERRCHQERRTCSLTVVDREHTRAKDCRKVVHQRSSFPALGGAAKSALPEPHEASTAYVAHYASY